MEDLERHGITERVKKRDIRGRIKTIESIIEIWKTKDCTRIMRKKLSFNIPYNTETSGNFLTASKKSKKSENSSHLIVDRIMNDLGSIIKNGMNANLNLFC